MNKIIIKKDLDAIATVDSDIAEGIRNFGYPQPRIRTTGLETFLSIIVSQQLSTSVAQVIMGRVKALVPDVQADKLLALPKNALRNSGLSGRKVEYVMALALAVVDKRFVPEQLSELDDEAVIGQIISLRGFGRWSAEIYLLLSLQRRNIFPADDLALRVALQKLKGLHSRPTAKCARQMVTHWAPFRSVGSLFLWHYYRGAPA